MSLEAVARGADIPACATILRVRLQVDADITAAIVIADTTTL